MRPLLDVLREPGVEVLDMDGEDRIAVHRAILQRKRMFLKVFVEFHKVFRSLEQQYLSGEGVAIELGAGVAPMRDSYPDVLSSDIVFGRHLDCVLDAQRMALRAESVRVIYGQNCFHHFPEPAKFFAELQRVLVPGGGAILLEPYYGPVASFLFTRLFRTEGFDKSSPAWETPVTGPMNGANQALSYIVFERDRGEFETKFPQLCIVHHGLLGNYLKYFASGGLNFRQLLPDASISFVDAIERLLSPLNRWLALHHVLVLRRFPG